MQWGGRGKTLSGLPLTDRAEYLARRILLVALVVLGVGWGALGALQGKDKIQTSSAPVAVHFARVRFERDLCVIAAIRAAVPRGAAVYPLEKGSPFWYDVLGPMSTPNYVVLAKPEPGAYSLRIIQGVPGASKGVRCQGHGDITYPPIVLVAREIPEPKR